MPLPAEVDTPSDIEVRIRRSFSALPELVFDAHTLPVLLRRWYGPPGWTMTTCEIDLRPGGRYRFVTRQPDGREIGQRGVYQEVSRPRQVVYTETWEDWNPGEVLVTTAFVLEGNGTRVTVTTRFPNQQVRDQLIAFGMTDGTEASFRKLDELLRDS
jgi:uncharacterized protein YndB with AHSA1/START domain